MKKILAGIICIIGLAIMIYPMFVEEVTRGKQDEMKNKIKDTIYGNVESNDDNNQNEVEEVAGQKVIGLIEIKKINVELAIVEGTEDKNINVAIGHMIDTASIGEKGNCVLAGHRGGLYGEFFKKLNKLENEDEVVLTDLKGNKYFYKVCNSFVVEEDNKDVLTQDINKEELTLITCEDNGIRRLIVKCKKDKK